MHVEKARQIGRNAIQRSRLRVTLPLYIKRFSRVLALLLHLYKLTQIWFDDFDLHWSV